MKNILIGLIILGLVFASAQDFVAEPSGYSVYTYAITSDDAGCNLIDGIEFEGIGYDEVIFYGGTVMKCQEGVDYMKSTAISGMDSYIAYDEMMPMTKSTSYLNGIEVTKYEFEDEMYGMYNGIYVYSSGDYLIFMSCLNEEGGTAAYGKQECSKILSEHTAKAGGGIGSAESCCGSVFILLGIAFGAFLVKR